MIMNDNIYCKNACSIYGGKCPNNATEKTTIFDNAPPHLGGGHCEKIVQIESIAYKIDIPYPYCLIDDCGKKGTFIKKSQLNIETAEMEEHFQPICHNATYITKSFIDPFTGIHYLNWVYEYKGRCIENIVTQKELLTTYGLKNLTEKGLNVPESMVRPLCEYYAALINESDSIKECEIFSKFGWVDSNNGFVIGKCKITKTDRSLTHLTKDIQQENTKALTPKGTVGGWLDATSGLLQYDNVRFVCYAATTALILKILNGASFVVELVGDTSIGKTVAAQVAISCVGDPDKLKLATSATKTFIERTCAKCNDLPIYLDETSAMQKELLKEIIYMVESGTGRGRAKKDGGVNDVDKWKSVLITTGEAPLTNMASLGGQDVRIVSIYGGVGKTDLKNVEYFKEHINNHYGVIAPLLIKKILNERDNLKEFYIKIRNGMKEYSKSDKTGVMNRVVDTYSLIALSGFVFESVMEDLGKEPINAGELVANMFCDKINGSDGSISDRAFSIITDWITTNQLNFCTEMEGSAGDRHLLYGNIGMQWPDGEAPYDYVDIVPNKLKEVLEKEFEHPGIGKQILREWKNDDKIVCDNEGKSTLKATLKKGMNQTRVVRIKFKIKSGDDY